MSRSSVCVFIGFRYLLSKRFKYLPSINVFFSILSLTIGIAALISVSSVLNGFTSEVIRRLLGANAHVYITQQQNSSDQIQFADHIIDVISVYPDVVGAEKIITTEGMILGEKNPSSVFLYGIKSEDFLKKSKRFESINIMNRGNPFLSSDEKDKGIIIGSSMMSDMRLKIGSKVSIIVPVFEEAVFGSFPRYINLEVVGSFTSGSQENDRYYAFISPDSAKSLLGLSTEDPNQIKIYLNDHKKSLEFADIIRKFAISKGFKVITWNDMYGSFIDAMKIENIVISFVLFLFVLIANISIFSNIASMIHDKRRSIAILRCMGFETKDIVKIFSVVGLTIVFTSSILGVSIGLLITKNINKLKVVLEKTIMKGYQLFNSDFYGFEEIPTEINANEIFLLVAVCIFVGIISTMIPSLAYCSKNRPVDVMKDID